MWTMERRLELVTARLFVDYPHVLGTGLTGTGRTGIGRIRTGPTGTGRTGTGLTGAKICSTSEINMSVSVIMNCTDKNTERKTSESS